MMEFYIILIFITTILFIPTLYAFLIGAPIALTSKSRIEEIIKKAEIKRGDKFYELGTGTGRVMVIMAKYRQIKVIGFELSPVFYFITWLNLKINGIKNYKLYLKNFFNANINEADIVFCFLIPKTMEKLKDKFIKELKPETKIISFAFQIKGWVPYAVIQGGRKPPVYFYKIK